MLLNPKMTGSLRVWHDQGGGGEGRRGDSSPSVACVIRRQKFYPAALKLLMTPSLHRVFDVIFYLSASIW